MWKSDGGGKGRPGPLAPNPAPLRAAGQSRWRRRKLRRCSRGLQGANPAWIPPSLKTTLLGPAYPRFMAWPLALSTGRVNSVYAGCRRRSTSAAPIGHSDAGEPEERTNQSGACWRVRSQGSEAAGATGGVVGWASASLPCLSGAEALGFSCSTPISLGALGEAPQLKRRWQKCGETKSISFLGNEHFIFAGEVTGV